jgi:Ca2+-transporting ATPase
LLPAQVLWINLLTHGPVGVAMGAEPAAPDVLDRPPRRPSAGVFDRPLVVRVVATAAALTAVCLAVALVARASGGPWQTQLFVALATGQLTLALALRPAGAWRAGRSAAWLPFAVAVNAVLLVAAIYVPVLRDLLGTTALTLGELGSAAGAAALTAVVVGVLPRRTRRSAGAAG